MKRDGRLIEAATSYDSMRLAWLKSRKGKARSVEARAFEQALDRNLDAIARDLRRGEYRWSALRTFKIFDPKEREIAAPAFHDRVAQHALFNVCADAFNRRQIDQSCACRRGKGQTEEMRLARRFAASGGFFLKLDVRKYFASINRAILKDQLRRLFKDRFVLTAFFDFLESYRPGAERGIPLGALSSQFFANHYLLTLDLFVKQ